MPTRASASGWRAPLPPDSRILTTVIEDGAEAEGTGATAEDGGMARARAAAERVDRRLGGAAADRDGAAEEGKAEARMSVASLIQGRNLTGEDTAGTEAAKGYDLLFAGLADPLDADSRHFTQPLAAFLETAQIPVAIALGGRSWGSGGALPRHILAPTDGTAVARLATEIAVALARAAGSRLTVLHVIEQPGQTALLRRTLPAPEESVLHQAEVLARRHSVRAELREVVHARPGRVIRGMSRRGIDLVVVGATLRQDGTRFLGPRTSQLIREVRTPILLVAR